jgi:hypothetical protein
MRYLWFAFLLVLICTAGCGTGSGPASPLARESAKDAPRQGEEKAAKDQAGGKGQAGEGRDGKQPLPRKIIYTANVDLIVEDFGKAAEELKQLVAERDGFVATADVQGETGQPRSGRWTLRVPVEHFDALLTALTKLGEARRSTLDSQDISENYYDLKERLKTYQTEEEGLRSLYKEKAPNSKLDELAVLRREMTAVRAQIDEMVGRLKRWDNQTELATVIVSMRDRKDYVPSVVPDFGGSVGRTFQQSIEALVSLGKGIVLVIVALAPWVAIVGVLGSPGWWRLWQVYRAWKNRPALPQPVAAPPAAPSA